MATEIARAAATVEEETRTADTTVDGEEAGGVDGYVMGAPGAVIPIPVTDPGAVAYPVEAAPEVAAAASATEETSSNI